MTSPSGLLHSIENDPDYQPSPWTLEQQATITSLVLLGHLQDEDDFAPEVFDNLSDRQLWEVSATSKRLLLIQPLIRQCTLLEGEAGTGKSLGMVAVSKMMKEYLGMPIVVIGSRMDLNSNFGDYVFLSEEEFLENLSKITSVGKATSDEELGSAIQLILRQEGVEITDALLNFDEAYKLFDARTPSDKLVRVFGYFIAQRRHYRSTVLLSAPDRRDLDRRIRTQIGWYGQCTSNGPKTSIVLRNKHREAFLLKLHGPNWWGMYDTHALVGFRQKHLKFKEGQF